MAKSLTAYKFHLISSFQKSFQSLSSPIHNEQTLKQKTFSYAPLKLHLGDKVYVCHYMIVLTFSVNFTETKTGNIFPFPCYPNWSCSVPPAHPTFPGRVTVVGLIYIQHHSVYYFNSSASDPGDTESRWLTVYDLFSVKCPG